MATKWHVSYCYISVQYHVYRLHGKKTDVHHSKSTVSTISGFRWDRDWLHSIVGTAVSNFNILSRDDIERKARNMLRPPGEHFKNDQQQANVCPILYQKFKIENIMHFRDRVW